MILRIFVLSAAAVGLVGIIGVIGCKDSGSETTGPGPTPVDSVSFSQQIQPLFSTYHCTGCHPAAFPGLSLQPGQSYSQLVNQQAQAGCTDKLRVQPGNADESVLVLRLAGSTCGVRMPQGGNPISSSDMQLIRTWINQGAHNN